MSVDSQPADRDESQSALSTWLSKSNRADPQNAGEKPSAGQSRKQPLTDRDGISLRSEVRDLDAPDQAATWQQAIYRYREYIRDKADEKQVFENAATGETSAASKPHRFATEYGDKQYAKLKDLERGVGKEFGKRLHTAMLTFTASSLDGGPLPPVDHLDELLESWDAIRRALDRVLEDHRFARLAILEPHPGDGVNNGYLHIHIAVFIDGRVEPEAFEPVIDAHLNNCDQAERSAHSVDDISVRHAGLDRRDPTDDDTLDELAIYLAEYLGTYGDDDPLDEPEHVQASNAILWATGRQRWRPCQTAQQFMKYDGPEKATDWEYIGIEKDGEIHEVDSSAPGGVDTFTTGEAPDLLDPPPD